MKMQLINSADGSLTISHDCIISNTTGSGTLITYFGKESIMIRDMGNGWKHYTTWNVQKDDRYFVFTFMFDNDILKNIDFILDDKIILAGSWDDWNKEHELRKKEYFEVWLTNEIGSARQFSWGSIGTFYDQHGGFSSIGLKYK